VAAGHPVSPSDAVDQAWHLHLLYTQSYWERFCKESLGWPLHHHPSKGGRQEREKFGEWQSKTLASYRRLFGEEPPADIWPDPARPESQHSAHRRVDLGRHWVIPKPRLPLTRTSMTTVGAVLLLAILLGCGMRGDGPALLPMLGAGNWLLHNGIADMPGEYFAVFYLGVATAAAIYCWRRAGALDTSRTRPPFEPPADLDPRSLSYLRGNVNEVLRLTIFDLLQRGYLKVVSTEKKFLRFVAGPSDQRVAQAPVTAALAGLSPVEREVYDMFAAARSPAEVFQSSKPPSLIAECERIEARLAADELTTPTGMRSAVIRLGLGVAAIVLSLGAYKLAVALAKGYYNILFLVLISLGIAAALAVICRPRRLSKRGRDYLKSLQGRFDGERCRLLRGNARAPGPAMLLAVSLYGYSVLSSTAYASLKTMFQQGAAGDGGCGGGCGGSGCGGGGCGGGGCGGCGGGGD
jgi:uncharacterized protein (TIGR04222 family)